MAVDNKYIEESIAQLVALIGVRDPAPVIEYISLIRTGQIKEAIEAIAWYLNLPIKVNLMFVDPSDIGATQFQSSGLVHTDHTGRGVGGITAQVIIPTDLPLYGSDRFHNMTFTVKVSKNAANNPQTFIAVMAHELCHVVLYSLWYKEKENEVHTDLAAMLLGFADAMRHGRKIVRDETPFLTASNYRKTSTTTYGYLSDQQFNYAYGEVSELIREGQAKLAGIHKEINQINSCAIQFEKEVAAFERGLILLGKRGNLKMNSADSQKLVSFHHPGFLDELKDKISAISIQTKKVNLRGLQPHKATGREAIRNTTESLQANRIKCQRIVSDMAQNNRLIRNYLGIKNRLKIRVSSFFNT